MAKKKKTAKKLPPKRPRRNKRKDVSLTALSIVERAIGGKLKPKTRK